MDKIDVFKLYNITETDKYISNFIRDNSINIEFEYLSDFIHTKILRDYVRHICRLMGLEARDITRIILIVDEMNNNSIEYGSNKGDINKLRINITSNNDFNDLVIEVEDSGKGSKPRTALEMETLRAHQLKLGYGKHNSIRGRGLFMIIVSVVDRLYFKDAGSGGLIVGIRKKMKI